MAKAMLSFPLSDEILDRIRNSTKSFQIDKNTNAQKYPIEMILETQTPWDIYSLFATCTPKIDEKQEHFP
jgi:hypothetical protein